MRFAIALLLMFSFLYARENPFVPVETSVKDTEGSSAVIPSAGEKKVQAPIPSAENSAKVQTSESKPEIINFQHIRFLVQSERIRIETKDKLIKDFTIANPTRFILDFKSEADFPTRSRTLNTPPFKGLRMGVHKGFYRVVIELDGKSTYTITPYKYGYLLIRSSS